MTALTLARQLLDSTRLHVQKSDDPYVISRFGDLQIRVDVAAALLERADSHPSPVAATEAQIAAAEALIAASNAEFELTGQRTALPSTLDDPLRRKYQIVGNYHLNGVL
ncbi:MULTISPECIES: acyl-CoA dehydrogenase [Pseudomonas]|jgi:alkylation response protein AidB-like acyl-CoA dehydrogenase|uniref:Acyl-CoA dehydrogenase n=2 Tax=Pseudomonas TaxID=286 RepID=A0A4Y9TAZ9_PSEFL|nr:MULTISPECIES: acyl-CoA dehydrogenase [Pseudomonas]CRM91122.1 sulfur acquisition oxidoreductase, SfnB family [Pseudomonas sp. 22 E 5]MCX9153874.1 acyl-CoA dehydrogenase [Pseudomonas sp. TB1-B1]QXH65509.1 acyl-CoA dehydrogenase [Pseudomonas asgharzadehiana]TFW41291.1 acyl-CoA dehydrogenase [Pseudomonas fluorescens]TKJ65455.1 acyl-CoA dehydrogenase [Pseudomonas sp. CFBP13506]